MKGDKNDTGDIEHGHTDPTFIENKTFDIDDLLKYVGSFGRFQWLLDAIFCLMMIPTALQMFLIYFTATVPSWKCVTNSSVCLFQGVIAGDNNSRCHLPVTEWLYMESSAYSVIVALNIRCEEMWIMQLSSSVFFIGWGIGAIIFGAIADCYGRKPVMFASYLVLMIVGLINPFVKNVWVFVVCRFLIGVASTGSTTQMFTLISEFVGTKHRPLATNLIFLSCSTCFCVLPLMVYFVRRWQHLYLLCIAPYVWLFFSYKFVPESIYWLYSKGKIEEIKSILTNIAKWNKTDLPSNISLPRPPENLQLRKSSNFMLFLSPRFAGKTVILCYDLMVCYMVYYGLSFISRDLGGSMYRDFVLVAVPEIPAVLLSVYLMRRFGRKLTSIVSMILGGAACLCVVGISINSSFRIIRVVLGIIGKLFITISSRAVFVWSIETYPTIIRGKASGFMQVSARIGAASSPWIVKSFKSEYAPFLIMGFSILLGSALSVMLPETKGVELMKTDNIEYNVESDSIRNGTNKEKLLK